MKEREDKPTAPRRGRITVRLTVTEIWIEIVGGAADRDVTERHLKEAIQIFGGQRKGLDKPSEG